MKQTKARVLLCWSKRWNYPMSLHLKTPEITNNPTTIWTFVYNVLTRINAKRYQTTPTAKSEYAEPSSDQPRRHTTLIAQLREDIGPTIRTHRLSRHVPQIVLVINVRDIWLWIHWLWYCDGCWWLWWRISWLWHLVFGRIVIQPMVLFNIFLIRHFEF